MPRSPSGASARPSPRVLIKSLERNALHTSQIRDMVRLNGNRSSAVFSLGLCTLVGAVASYDVQPQERFGDRSLNAVSPKPVLRDREDRQDFIVRQQK